MIYDYLSAVKIFTVASRVAVSAERERIGVAAANASQSITGNKILKIVFLKSFILVLFCEFDV